MLRYFNFFISYSFIGFILETFFSLVIKGRLESRKCYLISVLCPVYGIGAIAINGSTKKFKNNKILTFFVGAVVASIVELLTDIFYSKVLGARFWNYSKKPFNLGGSICLGYSIIWGLLSLVLVYFLHPYVDKNINKISKSASICILLLLITDTFVSAFLLNRFKSKKAISIGFILDFIKTS